MAATKKNTTAKKPTAKTTKPRKTTTKRRVSHAEPRSFKQSADTTPFLTFRFTQQTVYWIILSALVLALGVWVTNLNIKVQKIYDQIEINSVMIEAPAEQKDKN